MIPISILVLPAPVLLPNCPAEPNTWIAAICILSLEPSLCLTDHYHSSSLKTTMSIQISVPNIQHTCLLSFPCLHSLIHLVHMQYLCSQISLPHLQYISSQNHPCLLYLLLWTYLPCTKYSHLQFGVPHSYDKQERKLHITHCLQLLAISHHYNQSLVMQLFISSSHWRHQHCFSSSPMMLMLEAIAVWILDHIFACPLVATTCLSTYVGVISYSVCPSHVMFIGPIGSSHILQRLCSCSQSLQIPQYSSLYEPVSLPKVKITS